MLSVIIPSFNEEQLIMKTAEVISGLLKGQDIEHELLFVNDGSSDKTWEEIQKREERKRSRHILLPELREGSSNLRRTRGMQGRLCSCN